MAKASVPDNHQDERLAATGPDGPDEMGRDIAEGPEAVAKTLVVVEDLRPQVMSMLSRTRRIVLLGTGASLATSQIAAAIWRARLPPATSLIVRQSTEAALGDFDGLPFGDADLVFAISQSGTSPETLAAARRARDAGAGVLALTARPDSPLATAATLVVPIASGEERGAATKSELSTLAALLAFSGSLGSTSRLIERVRRRLDAVVASWPEVIAPGHALSEARHVWILGFGADLGIAQAGALLWHEKVLRPALGTTPSEFRHGLVEAAVPEDAVILVNGERRTNGAHGYLDRLRAEVEMMRMTLVELDVAQHEEADEAIQPLATLLRLQQLARATALAGGTYRDGFAVLYRVVTAANDLFA
jgi:glutamine---fructose-6-phosphate transaminase (isomerizing)